MSDRDALLGLADAAKRLGISYHSLRRLIGRSELDAFRSPLEPRVLYVRATDVARLKAEDDDAVRAFLAEGKAA
jgi:hypothetical protein